MEPFDVIVVLALAVLVAIQTWLTIRVWKSKSYERSQKALQTKLIWLLPIVGAVLVFSLMPPEEEDSKSRTQLRG